MVKDVHTEDQNVIPGKLAETTPPSIPAHDYTPFTFQVIMEIQKSIGQLEQAVTTLTEESKKRGDTLDLISHQVYAAKVVMWVIGIILTGLSGIAVFLLNKMWDAIIPLLQIKPHP